MFFNNFSKQNVSEDKIILLAFTNKACEELQSRINESNAKLGR